MLNGAYSFCGQFGIMIFSLLCGYLFDNIGPYSPFILMGILDFTFAFVVLILSYYGLFNVYEMQQMLAN